jgi:hypothetical protein
MIRHIAPPICHAARRVGAKNPFVLEANFRVCSGIVRNPTKATAHPRS